MKLTIKLDKAVSTNDFYKSHWTKKTKIKELVLSKIVFNKKEKIVGPYEVIYNYRSRIDVDNNAAIIKILIDFLRREDLLDEDYNSVFKKLTIIFDETLQKNESIMIIKKYK